MENSTPKSVYSTSKNTYILICVMVQNKIYSILLRNYSLIKMIYWVLEGSLHEIDTVYYIV